MQKTSTLIPGSDGKWGSYVSKFPPDSGRVLPNMLTAGTRDIVTAISGQVDKRTGGTVYDKAGQLVNPISDQYEGIFLSQVRLLIVNDGGTIKTSSGNGMFPAATNGTGFTNPSNFEFSTIQNRVYGDNGIDNPIVIDTVTSYGGVTYPVNQARVTPMGAFAPSSAPIVTLNVDSTANQVPAGAHTYKITFVYYNGVEESNGGPASTPVTNDATHTSNTLTSIPVGGYGVTAKNIYRDNNDGNWLLLDTLHDNTTTTYDDKLLIGSTPTPIPTTHNTPPVFKYICSYLDRLFVIDVTGKNIFWSLAGEPDVFDPENSISGPQDDIMTAIYVFNGIPWVFGQHTIGTILGTTDSTFFYNPVSTTVGCVDNRSIQTRSIISVPTMIWLSATPNRGLYYTNGSTVQYLSELIEDLASNVSQISYLVRNNTQNSLAAFQGDTSSPGIDLLTNPGTVQTIDPDIEFQNAIDWASGTLSNLAPIGDTLRVPIAFAPALVSGTLGGDAEISGGNLVLPTIGNNTGNSSIGFFGGLTNDTVPIASAEQLLFDNAGTITSVSIGAAIGLTRPDHTGSTYNITGYYITIWSDSLGQPGSILFQGPFHGAFGTAPLRLNSTDSCSVAVNSGQKIWIGAVYNSNSQTFPQDPVGDYGPYSGGINNFFIPLDNATGNVMVRYIHTPFEYGPSFGAPTTFPSYSSWVNYHFPANVLAKSTEIGYAFIQTPVSDSGTWTSPVYDSLCPSPSSGMVLDIAASYPSGASSSVAVEGATVSSGPFTTTDTLSSPNGTDIALTGGVFRFWKIVITISTTDNRGTPHVGPPTLEFNTQGVWTSPAITCTSDITSLNTLTDSVITPVGTSVTLSIATSPDNITYTSFGPIGSALPQAFAKIRATLSTDADNTVSPTLNQMELDWSVTSTIISSIIDTGQVPVGWGNFQFQRVGLSGSLQFYFRSASTSGGIPSATFIAISNGQIPTNGVFEFCQWKAVLSSTADNLAAFDSVTVNWLLTKGQNLRAASLFFNKSYYLAVASQSQTHNDTLIELDYEGNWRIHRENIGTMGLFLSDAYNGDSTLAHIYNMFKLTTDNGSPITFDLRTKCFNWATQQQGDNIHLKVVRACKLKGVNTGTLLHMYYSIDRGISWIEMLNSAGTLGLQTDTSGTQFVEYFIPNFDGSVQISAPNLMFRVVSSDAFPATILTVEPVVYIRKGKFIREEAATWP